VTLAEFIAKYDRQPIRDYGGQCVAVLEHYNLEVLGVPVVWANAIDWFGKDAAYLTWTKNVWGDPNNKPNASDIMVWGESNPAHKAPLGTAETGPFGHIAICVDPGDGMTFTAFGQNYPKGSPCHVQRFTYDGVIGWGDKPKPPTIPLPVTVPVTPSVTPPPIYRATVYLDVVREDLRIIRDAVVPLTDSDAALLTIDSILFLLED